MLNNSDKIACKLTFYGRKNGEWIKIEINFFFSKSKIEKLIREANDQSCVKSKLPSKSRSFYVCISHCSIFNTEDENNEEERTFDDYDIRGNILIKVDNLPIIHLIINMLNGFENLKLLDYPMFDYDDYPQFSLDCELSHLSTIDKIKEYFKRMDIVSRALYNRMSRMSNINQKSTSPTSIQTNVQDVE